MALVIEEGGDPSGSGHASWHGAAGDDPMTRSFGRDRPVQGDVAVADDDQPVADRGQLADDVRRQDDRGAGRADDLPGNGQELAAGERVEAGQRLVEEQRRSLGAERQYQRDLRLLAARQLAGAPAEWEPQARHPAIGGRPVEAAPERGGEIQVVGHRQVAIERRALGDVPDAAQGGRPVAPRIRPPDRDVTGRRPLQADPGPDESGLAGAVRADQGRHRAGWDLDVDALEGPRPSASVALAQAVRGQCGVRHRSKYPSAARDSRHDGRRRCRPEAVVSRVAVRDSPDSAGPDAGCTVRRMSPRVRDALALCLAIACVVLGGVARYNNWVDPGVTLVVVDGDHLQAVEAGPLAQGSIPLANGVVAQLNGQDLLSWGPKDDLPVDATSWPYDPPPTDQLEMLASGQIYDLTVIPSDNFQAIRSRGSITSDDYAQGTGIWASTEPFQESGTAWEIGLLLLVVGGWFLLSGRAGPSLQSIAFPVMTATAAPLLLLPAYLTFSPPVVLAVGRCWRSPSCHWRWPSSRWSRSSASGAG